MRTTVVVCEDSLVQRTRLVRALEEDGTVEVVAQAGTVDEALTAVRRTAPDVVTMDLEMPGGGHERPGGVVAIERIVEQRPVPVLVLSAHARARTDTLAIEALDAGAAEIFPKDLAWTPGGAADLRRLLGLLGRLRIAPRRGLAARAAAHRAAAGAVVALVASTGGPSALRTVIGGLSGVAAPVLVMQHIHPEFVSSFAHWLGETTGMPARVAAQGARPEPGQVHVAPAAAQLRLAADGTLLVDAEADAGARSSGDEMLLSLARHAGPATVAAVLTGMGDDGARGLLAVRRAGGRTFAQDGGSAVVDAMPRAARELGAAQHVVPLDGLASAMGEAVAGVRP